MNKYHNKIERLYSEIGMVHTYNELGVEEIKRIAKEKGYTKIEQLLPLIFDYAFKCGLRRALQILQEK